MDACLRQAGSGDGDALKRFDIVLNHGDPHESNMILMSKNRVGFVDFPDAVWARAYWGIAALDATAQMHPSLNAALRKTLAVPGSAESKASQSNLADLIDWYGKGGGKGWLK